MHWCSRERDRAAVLQVRRSNDTPTKNLTRENHSRRITRCAPDLSTRQLIRRTLARQAESGDEGRVDDGVAPRRSSCRSAEYVVRTGWEYDTASLSACCVLLIGWRLRFTRL